MTRLGADPEQLDALARRFDQAASQLDTDISVVRRELEGMFWRGERAERFRSQFAEQTGPGLHRVAEEFRRQAGCLRRNATEQRRASATAPTSERTEAVARGVGDRGGPALAALLVGGAVDGSLSSRQLWAGTERGWEATNHMGPLRLSTVANGLTGVVTEGWAGAHIGVDGANLATRGRAFAGAEGSVSAEAEAFDGLLHAKQRLSAAAGAEVIGEAHLDVSWTNLDAGASASAMAGARVDHAGALVVAGGVLAVHQSATAFAGARASASAGIKADAYGTSGYARVDAFVGAEVETEGDVEVLGGGASLGAGVKAYAGAGVDLSAEFAMGIDEIGVELDVGAALGIGAGVTIDLSVSPRKLGRHFNLFN